MRSVRSVERRGLRGRSTDELVPDFQNFLIGKNEYDYCLGQLNSWAIWLGGMLYPETEEILSIFLNDDEFPAYDSTSTKTLLNADGTYEQKNCLGMDETVNLLQGTITEYYWAAGSDFADEILGSDKFFDRIIRPGLEALDIDGYYAANPGVDEHTFNIYFNGVVSWQNADEYNLSKWLGQATIDFTLYLYTERGRIAPEITGVKATGTCVDLYDFEHYGNDDHNGWAARLQTSHSANHQPAGEVFALKFNLDVPEYLFWIDVYHNDIEGFKSKWQSKF